VLLSTYICILKTIKIKFMKTNHLHYIVLLAAIFLGSCSEEIEKELTTGKTAVTIEVDGEEDADSRTVSFTGGTAYGEGLYDGKEIPTVGAEASDGYEIDYFYGGPAAEPKRYNYTGSGSSVSYQVSLGGEDHHFKCKFKEKKRTLTLTANPTSGGTVTGGETYKVKTNIPITAVAKSGYTFSGWTVTKGDAKIMNASSASTTVQLQSSNSTLQANFKQSVTIINVSFKDEVLMGQLTRTVSVTSGHSATYTVYGVEITEREDDRGNYDSWEENYTFAVTSGSPASRLDSYDKYNGDVSESMTSKEKSFTLVVDGVTVCSSEPISNVGKVDKVIGNYRYIF
jgi:uncharacterized repeat protein (TIGR02543 family)